MYFSIRVCISIFSSADRFFTPSTISAKLSFMSLYPYVSFTPPRLFAPISGHKGCFRWKVPWKYLSDSLPMLPSFRLESSSQDRFPDIPATSPHLPNRRTLPFPWPSSPARRGVQPPEARHSRESGNPAIHAPHANKHRHCLDSGFRQNNDFSAAASLPSG